MRTLTLLLALGLPAAPSLAQEEAAPEPPADAAPAPVDAADAASARVDAAADAGARDGDPALTAARLRERVRTMRRDVLVGGEAVEESEKEALRFYRKKVDDLARRADDLRTQRDIKQSEYELALDTTLKARSEAERQQAAREAGKLRAELRELDAEVEVLDRQGATLGQSMNSIRRRGEQRQRLRARFERPAYVEELPYVADSLLEFGEEEEAAGDPFADEAFLEDLIRRDPQRARAVLYEYDARRYWERFPLTPPHDALKRALRLPPPDLPGRR